MFAVVAYPLDMLDGPAPLDVKDMRPLAACLSPAGEPVLAVLREAPVGFLVQSQVPIEVWPTPVRLALGARE